ncbi:MAG: hypothetical protein AAFV46_00060 [Cyanobacteria bacterium J06635_11]
MLEPYGYRRVAFADALKDAAATMTGWPRHWFDDRKRKDRVIGSIKRGLTPRKVCIDIGQLGRSYAHDWWVDRVLSRYGRIVIPDVRFPNEADAIREQGGEVWRIERPGVECSGDETETALDDYAFFSWMIYNDLSWSHLMRRVDERMNETLENSLGY